MIRFFRKIFAKRQCSICLGTGWHEVAPSEYIKCCVCAGKGTL